jgi:hypothetical protein
VCVCVCVCVFVCVCVCVNRYVAGMFVKAVLMDFSKVVRMSDLEIRCVRACVRALCDYI